MDSKKTFVEVDAGERICLAFDLPLNEPKGIAVLLHGFGSSKDNKTNNALLPMLLRREIAVLRFDFRGCGESDGRIEDTTVSAGIQDLLAANRWLGTNFPKSSNIPLMLFGSSFGGAVAIASSPHMKLRELVLKSPIWDIYDMQLFQRGGWKMAMWKLRGYTFVSGKTKTSRLNYSYISDGKNYDLYALAKSAGIQTFTVHGTKDEVVPFSQSEKAEKLDLTKLLAITGADHRYSRAQEFDAMIQACVIEIASATR